MFNGCKPGAQIKQFFKKVFFIYESKTLVIIRLDQNCDIGTVEKIEQSFFEAVIFYLKK